MHPYVKRGAGLVAGVLITAATAAGAHADIIKGTSKIGVIFAK